MPDPNGLPSVRQSLERAASRVQMNAAPQRILGYPVRADLFPGEDGYFKGNPNVTGMAAEDGHIIFNPYSSPEINRDSVGLNEASRLFMRDQGITPNILTTPEQDQFFRGTAYEQDEAARKQTIIARIISGDPSVTPTPEQKLEADRIFSAASQPR